MQPYRVELLPYLKRKMWSTKFGFTTIALHQQEGIVWETTHSIKGIVSLRMSGSQLSLKYHARSPLIEFIYS